MNIRAAYVFPLNVAIAVIRAPLLRTPARAIQPLVAMDRNLVLVDEILEDLLRHVRLEDPHRPLLAVNGGRALPFVAVLLRASARSRQPVVVVFPDAMVELPRQPADHRLVAGVRETQAAARQAAEMSVRADEDDGLAHALGLNGRDDARRCAAVNDELYREAPARLRGRLPRTE